MIYNNPPYYILGLDPGKTTGWGILEVYQTRMTIHSFGDTEDMTMVEIKDRFEKATHIVYEGWWTRPKKANTGAFDWGKMEAPQAIGSIETMAKILGKTIHKVQQPASKVPGYGFLGMKYQKGKKGQHSLDALAHAAHYAVTVLKVHPVGVDSS